MAQPLPRDQSRLQLLASLSRTKFNHAIAFIEWIKVTQPYSQQFGSQNIMTKPTILILFLMLTTTLARDGLTVNVSPPARYGTKALLKLDLRNTFTNAIESARAVVFLLDDTGKVVGQETRWIIGGTKDRPPLPSQAKASFHFVVQSNKPFTKTKLTVTRLILAGGKQADALHEVEIISGDQ